MSPLPPLSNLCFLRLSKPLAATCGSCRGSALLHKWPPLSQCFMNQSSHFRATDMRSWMPLLPNMSPASLENGIDQLRDAETWETRVDLSQLTPSGRSTFMNLESSWGIPNARLRPPTGSEPSSIQSSSSFSTTSWSARSSSLLTSDRSTYGFSS